MMKRVFLVSLFCVLAGIPFVAAAQDDTTPPPTAGTTTTPTTPTTGTDTGLKQRTSLTAVRMSIVNGIVQTINNTRQVNMALEWDYLPLSHLLSDKAASFDVKPITIDISNNDLKSGADWPSKLSSPQRTLLMNALSLDAKTPFATADQRETSSQIAINNFQNLWYTADGASLRSSSISVPDFLASQRDFFCVLTLLRSQGINSSFSVENADVKGPNPRIESNDIHWHISIYDMQITAKVHLYRFTVAAKEDSFPVMFSNPNDTTATLNAKFSFIRHRDDQGRPNDILVGIAPQYLVTVVTQQNAALPAAKTSDQQLADPTDSLAPSSLESTLQMVGGVDLNDVISKGLLGGSAQSSFVSGGLFGRGRVNQLLGIDTDIWRRGSNSFGYTLGALPNNSNALFTGLTAQLGDLMLMPGFVAEPNANDTKTAFKGALGVSFDLGRVLGMKKDNTYPLSNSTNDPNWPASDDLYANLAAINYTLKTTTSPDSSLLAPAEIRLNWTNAGNTAMSTILSAASVPTLSAINAGNALVIVPLGYDLYFLRKILGSNPTQYARAEVQTTITASPVAGVSPTIADSQSLSFGQQLGSPLALTAGSAEFPLAYELAPGDGLLQASDISDPVVNQLKDASAPVAVALLSLLSPSAQAVVASGVSDPQTLATALNFVIAGNLLTDLTAADGSKPFATLASNRAVAAELAKSHSLNSTRMRANRRVIEQILTSLPKMP